MWVNWAHAGLASIIVIGSFVAMVGYGLYAIIREIRNNKK